MRSGANVLIWMRSEVLLANGAVLRRAPNEVLLTTGVAGSTPASLFSAAEDLNTGLEVPLDQDNQDPPPSSPSEEVPDWEACD